VGVPSVSGGDGAADTFSDDWIDAIRQGTWQERAFFGEQFSASYRFYLFYLFKENSKGHITPLTCCTVSNRLPMTFSIANIVEHKKRKAKNIQHTKYWIDWLIESSPTLPKNQFFGEKRPLNEKFSKFRYERIRAHTDSRIAAKFRGNRQSGSDQSGAWYSSRKRLVFCPFLMRLLERSRHKIYRFLFPIPLPSFVQIRPVFGEIYPKMSSRLITISTWSL